MPPSWKRAASAIPATIPARVDPDDYLGTLFIIIWCTLFFGGFAMAILPPIFGAQDRAGPLSLAGHGFQRQRAAPARSGSLRRRLVVGKLQRRRLVVRRQQRRRLLRRRRVVGRRRIVGELVMADAARHDPRRTRPHRRRRAGGGGENLRRNLLRGGARQRQLFLSGRLHGDAGHRASSACSSPICSTSGGTSCQPMNLVVAQLVADRLRAAGAGLLSGAAHPSRAAAAALPPCARQCDEAVPEPQHPPHHAPAPACCCSCRWPSAMPKSSPTPASTAACRRKPGTAWSPG